MKLTHYFVKPGSEADDVIAAEGTLSNITVVFFIHGLFICFAEKKLFLILRWQESFLVFEQRQQLS